MQNLIFLDIDGVMNCPDQYKYEGIHGPCEFYSKAKVLMNKLIFITGAKVVISSTWRADGLRAMQDLWRSEGMWGEVVGITPHLYYGVGDVHHHTPRGVEIDEYLRTMGYIHINWSKREQQSYCDTANLHNYVIIDDDSDFTYNQRNHFIHIKTYEGTDGFNQFHMNQAIGILAKTITELNHR